MVTKEGNKEEERRNRRGKEEDRSFLLFIVSFFPPCCRPSPLHPSLALVFYLVARGDYTIEQLSMITCQ